MIYKVKCNKCGFEYEVFSSNTSEEFLKELKECPCGAEAEVEVSE